MARRMIRKDYREANTRYDVFELFIGREVYATETMMSGMRRYANQYYHTVIMKYERTVKTEEIRVLCVSCCNIGKLAA